MAWARWLLPVPGRAEEEDVFVLGDEVAGCEVEDGRPGAPTDSYFARTPDAARNGTSKFAGSTPTPLDRRHPAHFRLNR
jgi:hypothetical protein